MSKWSSLAFLGFVSIMVGCARTNSEHFNDTDGYLGDYSVLELATRRQTLLQYQKPGVDWTTYDSFKLDPVTIWQDPDAQIFDMGARDRQKLADEFYRMLSDSLSRTHWASAAPRTGTLRIQVALIDPDASSPAMDTVSTILPAALLISRMVDFNQKRPSFIRPASLEIKVSDASTGHLLAAGVHTGPGGRSIDPATVAWSDVTDAIGYWSDLLAWQLCQRSGSLSCERPGGKSVV